MQVHCSGSAARGAELDRSITGSAGSAGAAGATARARQGAQRRAQSPDHYALGRAVRELRGRRDLSQEQLGAEAGLHRNYVGAIERGEINPTFRVMTKLGQGLGVTVSAILVLYEQRRAEYLRETSGGPSS